VMVHRARLSEDSGLIFGGGPIADYVFYCFFINVLSFFVRLLLLLYGMVYARLLLLYARPRVRDTETIQIRHESRHSRVLHTCNYFSYQVRFTIIILCCGIEELVVDFWPVVAHKMWSYDVGKILDAIGGVHCSGIFAKKNNSLSNVRTICLNNND